MDRETLVGMNKIFLLGAAAFMMGPLTANAGIIDVTGANSVTFGTGDSLIINFNLSSFQTAAATEGGSNIPNEIYFGITAPPVASPSSISTSASLQSTSFPGGLSATPIFSASTLSTNGSTYPISYSVTFVPLSLANYTSLFGASGLNSADIVLTNLGGSLTIGEPAATNLGLDGQAIFIGAEGTYPGGTFSTGWAPSSIELSTVPLPAAAWLMLGGLGSLGAFARKKRAA
jgi:hypothetical protein